MPDYISAGSLICRFTTGRFRGGSDRQIHEADEVLGVIIAHFFQQDHVALFGLLIDVPDMIGAGRREGNIDLPAIP